MQPTRNSDGTIASDKAVGPKSPSIFIGNVPFETTEEELLDIFASIGFVEKLKLFKGYAFCDYLTYEKAMLAVSNLDNTEIHGKAVRVRLRSIIEPAKKDRKESVVKIEGFPQRWTSVELREFLEFAVKREAVIGSVSVEPDRGNTDGGSGLIHFRDETQAQAACSKLVGQKIAGKRISISIDGVKIEGESGNPHMAGPRSTKQVQATIFIDELVMPERPTVEPSLDDTEVWVSPLPDDDELEDWLLAFGEVSDVFRVPDQQVGGPGEQGYIKFKDHDSAKRCVDSGAAEWSESERTLSSQRSSGRPGGAAAYPVSLVGLLLGARGETITALKEEIGATMVSLRGEGMNQQDTSASNRVHFAFKGTSDALTQFRPALERALERCHLAMQEKVKDKKNIPPPPPGAPPPGGSWPGGPWPWPPGPPPANGGWGPPHWPPPPPSYYGYPPPGWHMPPSSAENADRRHATAEQDEQTRHHRRRRRRTEDADDSRTHAREGGDAGRRRRAEDAGDGRTHAREGDDAGRRRRADDAGDGRDRASEGGDVEKGNRHRHRRRRDKNAEPEPGEMVTEERSVGADGRVRKKVHVRRKRRDGEDKHDNDEGEPTFTDNMESQPVKKAPSIVQRPPQRQAHVSPDSFFASLPPDLTEGEQDLRDAVLACLGAWAEEHDMDDDRPNLAHVGADDEVRACEAAALPPGVSLKSWLQERLSQDVVVEGQSIAVI